MYKITPERDLGLKTYWCTSPELAKQIAVDLGSRFNCDCKIENMPDKKLWESCGDEVRRFNLTGGMEMRCTANEFTDAQAHARNDVLKINAEEIFCFPAEDLLWQPGP